MNPSREDSSADDPRVLEASRAYLAELEAGQQPDRAAYLARYPEVAEALSECFDGIDLAHTLRPPPPLPQPEHPTSPLGDFQLLREIGRGGMGIVYEAVQLSLGRRVAVKVLPFAAALDARHLQRFKTEAQAAAQLHHTHIVPVYAVGCERGLHFYAMQLIDGRSLATVIDELRAEQGDAASLLATAPTADLQGGPTVAQAGSARVTQRSQRARSAYRTAARLAGDVADALEYAHEAGVIHRDIKPANLLVDARGAIWITDFGLAHVVADVGVTQTGDLVGTLRYMSPEQAGGRRTIVDHRTDVYSLGATLYELLTLEPIFPGQDRPTLLHQILTEDPRPLRQVDRSIPIELETIVLKAVAKNPAERYATAGEMAADLRRYLEERPILARRPTVFDRARKWLRRHPSFVAAGVILLVCGVIGLAAITGVVAHEQSLTKKAYQAESKRAAEAESRFQLARRAADDMIQLAEEELSDLPFQEGLRTRLLEAALAYYQEFIDLRGEDPDAQAELAVTRDRVKKILADLALLRADRQVYLLREPPVLDDLQATPEQRERLTAWLASRETQREGLSRKASKMTADERRQHSVEEARANDAFLSETLETSQLRRLRQIALQFRGPLAFRDPDVVRALKLTSQQREQIRELDAGPPSGGGPGPGPRPSEGPGGGRGRDGGPGPFGDRGQPPFHRGPLFSREDHEARYRSLMTQIVALLTVEQQQKWSELVGEPYRGPLGFPGREGRFGPPPR